MNERNDLIEAMGLAVAQGRGRTYITDADRREMERALSAIEGMAAIVPKTATDEMIYATETLCYQDGRNCFMDRDRYAAFLAASPFSKETSDGE